MNGNPATDKRNSQPKMFPRSVVMYVVLLVSVADAANYTREMRQFWLSLGGKSNLWSGPDMCNSADFVGVTCIASINTMVVVSPSNLNSSVSTRFIDPIIAQVVNIQTLTLKNCGLSGGIPSNIWNITSLINLDLSENQLSGDLPPLKNNYLISILNLGSNHLTGDLSFLLQLHCVWRLNLSSNHFSGSLPDLPSDMTRFCFPSYYMGYVDFSSNQINGTLPPSFGSSLFKMTITFNVDDNLMTSISSTSIPPPFNSSAGCSIRNNPIPCQYASQFLNCTYTCVLTSSTTSQTMNTSTINSSPIDISPLSSTDTSSTISQTTTTTTSSVSPIILSTDSTTSASSTTSMSTTVQDSLAPTTSSTFNTFTASSESSDTASITSTSSTTSQTTSSTDELLTSAIPNNPTFTPSTTSPTSLSTDSSSSSSAHDATLSPSTTSDVTSSTISTTSDSQSSTAASSPLSFSTVVELIQSLYNETIDLSRAENIVSLYANSAGYSLPSLLSVITSAVLRGNTSSFTIHSNNVTLVALTIAPSSIYNATSVSVQINDERSASVPTNILSGGNDLIQSRVKDCTDVTMVMSYIDSNPFPTSDAYTINGGVIGLTLYNGADELTVSDLSHPINITMGRSDLPNFICLYWAEVEREWKREGCQTLYVADRVTCQCNHLTNFSLGSVPPSPQQQVPSPVETKKTMTGAIVGCVVGGIFLAIVAISVFIIVRRKVLTERKSEISRNITFTCLVHHNDKREIWRANYSDTTQVAIKKCIDAKTRSDLIREATVMKEMHHPNIVQYLGQDLTIEAYYVMEWVGGSLSRYPVDIKIEDVSLQIARAMSYLSENYIVHTRLTLDHVLYERQENDTVVKLTGFSRSTFHGHKTQLDHVGLHTAPEVIESDGVQRMESDVYSFGVLLYRLSRHGEDPFDTKSQRERIKLIRCSAVGLDVEHLKDDALYPLIIRCIHRAKANRPNFQQITRELRDAMRSKQSVISEPQGSDQYGVVSL
ncbi:hypothetical protein PROFUN_03106 [Planoprotostelium fungivorum]|uniref:LRR receptor-like serine/threonine-protein kinase n=1 Tax=Planoprotostelium fungivorum TaxID=1890364 RepID=A0A2P6NQ89_9EUKA|nr:hypothetical protein PROFUN_03106 [Planoprotostelium fungivorum]